ncbi:ParA family protein [Acetobacter pasteurianus]|uniref:ParA family protein n=1 Tax=Acetobacter pasteurianus TaxID=438 RepID=UPI001E5BD710|nr:ParA family protein [Acetobacter pasteurianus]
MKTIAIISQKGGAGKTTLALHLATSASAAGYVSLILDTDPQATASSWKACRGGCRARVVVDSADHASLSRKREQESELGAELWIIDTAHTGEIHQERGAWCRRCLVNGQDRPRYSRYGRC